MLPETINDYESKLALSDRELSAGGVTWQDFVDSLASVKILSAGNN